MTTAQAIKFESQDQGEETARADIYGLLATLLYACLLYTSDAADE